MCPFQQSSVFNWKKKLACLQIRVIGNAAMEDAPAWVGSEISSFYLRD